MHCNKSKYFNATLVNPNNNEREREILHSSTDNRNVTRKNNSPEYLRLEILHSVHYTRKTQNSDDANTRRYTPFPSSLPSSRFPPTLWESYTTYIYIYIYARVVLHNAHRRNETWSVAAPLFTTEKHPFPLLSVEGSRLDRIFYASNHHFVPALRQTSA